MLYSVIENKRFFDKWKDDFMRDASNQLLIMIGSDETSLYRTKSLPVRLSLT